jgi:endoglucanase
MKYKKNICSLVLVFSFIGGRPQGTGYLKADGERIVNGKGQNLILRGVGLGGWMLQEGYMLHLNAEGQQYRIRERIEAILTKEQTAEFYKAWLSNQTTKSDIDSLHDWGFNSVRLPMHYHLFTLAADEEPAAGKNTWLTTGFELTDSLVSWCKANHMYVFLDLHAAPGGQGNDLNISDRNPNKPSLWQSELNKQKTIALWHKLAERYAGDSTVAGYDILNEPNWGFEDTVKDRNGLNEKNNQPLKQLMTHITRAIREVDSHHMIIIEGNGWGNNYRGILPPWDANMVLSFHKYWNNNDEQSIQHILNYRSQYHVPVWLGETGENSNTWFTDAIRLLESHNIGWSWWPLKKLGNNNPLQIKSNPHYDSLVSYWNGKTKQAPPPGDVYNGLMELASEARCENNIVHRDVIDAMIRQPFTNETIPFKANSVRSGTVIEAADYDLGVNGSAYYDKDTGNYYISGGSRADGNKGRMYRNDGVDIYGVPGEKGKYFVGSIEDGEWLQYTLDVVQEGNYDIELFVSADLPNSKITIINNDRPVAENIAVPVSGEGSPGKITGLININLSQGVNRLRVLAVKGGFSFYSIEFKYRSHL